jgi:hypothetical protein
MKTLSPKSLLRVGWLMVFILIAPLTLASSGEDAEYDFETILLGDFLVGNLNPPVAPPVPDIFMGEESYAYYIYPADQTNCTDDGFVLESITQRLFFDDQQVPANLVARGALLKADFDPVSDCWVPGPVLYEGPEETFSIIDNGSVTIQVPTPDAPNLLLADHYFLVLRYQGGGPAYLVVDDEPMPCIEYINRGAGWEDLYQRGKSGGGKVILFGDIVCSPASVPNTPDSWDAIKSLFK